MYLLNPVDSKRKINVEIFNQSNNKLHFGRDVPRPRLKSGTSARIFLGRGLTDFEGRPSQKKGYCWFVKTVEAVPPPLQGFKFLGGGDRSKFSPWECP
jgi:hypothetical protein